MPDQQMTPQRSTEVSRDDLERLAGTLGLTIYLPGPEGGWARITTPTGSRYHAWIGPAMGGV